MHTETRWKSKISVTDKQEDEAEKLQLAEMKRAHLEETVVRWGNLSVGWRCNNPAQAKFLCQVGWMLLPATPDPTPPIPLPHMIHNSFWPWAGLPGGSPSEYRVMQWLFSGLPSACSEKFSCLHCIPSCTTLYGGRMVFACHSLILNVFGGGGLIPPQLQGLTHGPGGVNLGHPWDFSWCLQG